MTQRTLTMPLPRVRHVAIAALRLRGVRALKGAVGALFVLLAARLVTLERT